MMQGNGADKSAGKPKPTQAANAELMCGIIMPISATDGASADHWAEVKAIITEAVDSIPAPRFSVRLVSEADEVGVIQKRIIHNVYRSEIVVCDVSGKNPNVMFELGLRLAFDKPTVIIKDDKTEYSFDTSVIEQIPYPRDLRFSKIVEFKTKLADKVTNTYNASLKDPKHSPFLRSFGEFHVASLPQTEVPADKLIMELLTDIQRDVQVLKRRETEAIFRRRRAVHESAIPSLDVLYDALIKTVTLQEQKTTGLSLEQIAAREEIVAKIGATLNSIGLGLSRAELQDAISRLKNRDAI